MVELALAGLGSGCTTKSDTIAAGVGGPLANDKDVQTEQMAVIAIGAKSLLLEMRNTLE